ncbi:hypothetical protein [Acinetobacter baumannii]|uniref:hypothetical protein n=1 Tax=Acinetobacter baumannii TaxID=470 RepID=UPI001126B161|nr:hypothetical protein [Acinetobacter baumannii]TPT26693.1 hypothetical protein FJU68_18950 [Acinetobacter baumannii]
MKTFLKILSLRLKFYRKSIVNSLDRRNQAVITISVLLAPAIFPILIFISSYISELTTKGNVGKSIFIWISILLFFYFFTIKQRDSILGGEMKKLIDIQPYSIYLKIMIDFILLIVIDIFFLLSFFISILYTYSENSNKFDLLFFYKIIYTITITLNIILFQILLLYKKRILFTLVLLSIISQILLSTLNFHLVSIILNIFLIIQSIISLKNNKNNVNVNIKTPKILLIKKTHGFLANLIRINVRYLFYKDEAYNRVFMFALGLSPIIIILLSHNLEWSKFLKTNLLIIFMVLQVFVVSSMEFSLQKLNFSTMNYWRTLNISKNIIYLSQLLTTLLIGLISFTPLLISTLTFLKFYITLYILFLILLNICLFSYINRNIENVHFVVKVLISITIYILTWFAINN